MSDLFEDSPAPSAIPRNITVSELSGAVKQVIEGEFGLVRVRGEVGRVSRARPRGICTSTLKDDRAVWLRSAGRGRSPRCRSAPKRGWR